MKKIMALVLAGTMVLSTPMMAGAASSPTAKDWYDMGKEVGEYKGRFEESKNHTKYLETEISGLRTQINDLYKQVIELAKKQSNITVTVKTSSNSKKKPKVTVKTVPQNTSAPKEITPTFVNTVTNAPGMDSVVPVGQGGKLVIGGVKTRATFVMSETTSAKVESAKSLGNQIGGSVKNVVETYAPGVRFGTCQVDFKVYGCKSGDIYKVYQLGGKGTWNEVQVDDIHDGHVVCTVSRPGTFAFFKMN